jgi:putative colanic acid biosynthesis acetyltransferase WcaF
LVHSIADHTMKPEPRYQNLAKFKMPAGFRGRPGWYVQLWWAVQATLFRCSPQFAYGFRAALLRVFGAKVGRHTVIRPSVTVTYPWKVSLGDHVWIGDDAVLYSLGPIEVGDHAVVSQRCYLCAGDHDAQDPTFPIRAHQVTISSQAWVAADCFIAPGVKIGEGAVIGARSSVFKDMPAGMFCAGSPAKVLRPRAQPTP